MRHWVQFLVVLQLLDVKVIAAILQHDHYFPAKSPYCLTVNGTLIIATLCIEKENTDLLTWKQVAIAVSEGQIMSGLWKAVKQEAQAAF